MRQKTLGQLINRGAPGAVPQREEPVTIEDLKRVLLHKIELETLAKAAKTEEGRSSLEPLGLLREAGFDLKSVTGGMKDAADVFKSIATEERQARGQVEQRVEELRGANAQLQMELIRTVVNGVLDKQAQLHSELKEALNKKPAEGDALAKMLQGVMAQVLERSVGQMLGGDRRSPQEELMEMLAFGDKLREYLGVRGKDDNGAARATALAALKTDVLKLVLEDEREREDLRSKRELERERMDMIKSMGQALKDILPDVVRAFAEAAAARRTEAEPPEGPAAQADVKTVEAAV